MRGENNWRFWLPVAALALFAVYSSQKLIRCHVDPTVDAPDYLFSRKILARRGSIYSSYGKSYPFVKSVPFWEYSLDPVSLTNAVVRRKGEPRRPKKAIVKTIAAALGLDYQRVLDMANAAPHRGYRNQFLALSSDPDAHRTIADSTLVSGVAIQDKQVRQYIHGRRLAHVLGSVNAEHVGSAGIEQRFNRDLTGTPGTIQGMRDAFRHELYDRRKVSIDPIPGADVYLTIDHNIQFEAEDALKWGLQEFGAGSGWCIVMDSRTGAILSMASLPDFEPLRFGSASDNAKINRAIAFNYEPGSVMKTLTVAAAIDCGFVRPGTVYRTNRDDPNYYRLPGDGSHVWEPTMTIRDAIVHSSNIVVGKLGYDMKPKRLYSYFRKFGLGELTGIELPGEQYGILPDPNKRMWDMASWSRAAIGQFVAVTGIQLISAYQAIANDGLRMRPYVVDKVVGSDGAELYRHSPVSAGRAISVRTAHTMRDIMLDVASPKGTARRAAIRGYSVAGKTGTAQKHLPGIKGYAPGLYRASFCGIVPASDPRLVILVTLDFDKLTKFHQGGNSAGPVFRRIATAALRYLMIHPDRPDELAEFDDDDEFDRIMEERARKRAGVSAGTER
ncbi:MAG: penicillin-binding protein 2 [Kiritimatiellae bacterium]|nr:penicillin-binding protein 2 [Kiritimatiellia bacterium]